MQSTNSNFCDLGPTLLKPLILLVFFGITNGLGHAQESAEQARVSSAINDDGTGTIIVEAHGQMPDPPVFFTASAETTAQVDMERVEQVVLLSVQVIQGNAETFSFGVNGESDVVGVECSELRSWSVRREGSQRFLDLHVQENVAEIKAEVKLRSRELERQVPVAVKITHLTPGDAIGFDSIVNINYAPGVRGTVLDAEGFVPLVSKDQATRFHTASGGQIELALNRDGTSTAPVELVDTTLRGELHSNGKSIHFRLRCTARVADANAEVTILSGNAAFSQIPTGKDYRLRLSTIDQRPIYQLVFPQAGTFPVTLDFVATLDAPKANWYGTDFTIAAGAVVPVTLHGLETELEFLGDHESIIPRRENDTWLGFLPANGRVKLQWKSARKTGEGKLFFATTGHVEAKVSAGLLRQDHQIDYRVLQGELDSLSLALQGPGEILDVQGSNIVAWMVSGLGDERQLTVSLSQPIASTSQIHVRSQTPLGAFPIRVEGLRLNPIGAIRHSGYLRVTNLGSVRLELTGLTGLTQLAPEQFPGKSVKARQNFVYRFPAASHAFTIAADRIQPEVSVAELVLYQLAETDRMIHADMELDIREAPIREWNFGIPSDYSVVAVTGASVADYVASSEETDGQRNLRVLFGQDVTGRQLISLQLEKSEVASEATWALPRIEYPDAKTVRGDIGIIGAPGFRIAVGETDLLVEKPLSYFPKPTANLQQAFRIRERGWSASMNIELLDRSVQSDVFHLLSLSGETVYGSALVNYFVTGAPVSEWRVSAPESLGNVMVDGQDIRTWRREGETLIVSLHQPVMGAYTLLVTYEEKPDKRDGRFQAGQIAPIGLQGERGYVQVVSPMQVEVETVSISEAMLELDPLELPAEFRLLSTAPPLGTWQYTERPFDLQLKVNWFQPGTTVPQVVEFSEANSRVSQDGELVTDVLYYVKSRGQRTLKIKLPNAPVRLWEVSVNGQAATARQTDDATLIPLPGGTDPNIPVEVRLRLGKPSVDESKPELTLPIVYAPVLKTQWNIVGDEKRILVPSSGTITPPMPVLRPSGFDWVAKRGLSALFVIGVLTLIGTWASGNSGFLRVLGLISLAMAIVGSYATAMSAYSQAGSPAPLQLSLPILSAGETVNLRVANTPLWRVNISWIGLATSFGGIATILWSFFEIQTWRRMLMRCGAAFLIGLGILCQRDGAPWFFALLALTLLLLFMQPGWDSLRDIRIWLRSRAERGANKKATDSSPPGAAGAVTATIILVALVLYSPLDRCHASLPEEYQAADSITQQWQVTHEDARLTSSGSITLSGIPGDRFLLLRAPAVLTRFEGVGLRLTKTDLPGEGLIYIISIPVTKESTTDESEPAVAATDYAATFEYQLDGVRPKDGMPVLTGGAAVQDIHLSYDEPGWDIVSPTAVRVESVESSNETSANVLLGPGKGSLVLIPKARDVTTEQTQFFVEASNLYLPGPGVVDGRHRIHVRTSQGQVRELNVLIPKGLTVSAVGGPVGAWQFDADTGRLMLAVEPTPSPAFDVMIDTQRGLHPLPTDVNLAPLRVADANGEVGLLAIAFGPDAKPEKAESSTMSAVNLGDFDASLLPTKQAVLHRVYRYGAEGGELALRVAPVDPEVRVTSKQVLSLGDERVVLGVNFAAEISRAGLFQLRFPLPDGLEVESLSGDSLHHWSELSEGDRRQIVLHLNGKTIGTQSFSVALSGPSPTEVGEWAIPRFELQEATRQTGELVVRPSTGIRLRTVSRQNVSETDPRTIGGKAQGALAFRLLQRNWNLVLGVEKLDPWVTGQVLHEVTLREGQTRSALMASFDVQNASIRNMSVILPITNDDVIKTLRASGDTVSDFVRSEHDSNEWEIQFKRRVVGKVEFRIEYERRGDRENENETLSPAGFPQVQQLSYFVGVRAGGRLELEHDTLTQGWQRADWSTVPKTLRDAGNRSVPALTLRALAPVNDLTILAKRHSLADALKLRVAKGSLTTVLSPSGDQLTAVDVTMEVIQRSSLTVGLPMGGELFSIFVNGESVHSIRDGGNANAWQFYILPGIDDRTAKVRFVYSVTGDRLQSLQLTSPQLNVPLENIEWNVVAPKGFLLTDNDGNLDLVRQSHRQDYDRDLYLSKVRGKRQVQAQQAAQLLEQASQLIQAGEQTKARWALNSVANQYALDAASNEDARVQLENLQTQQAIVGLNTRRQRLYIDNHRNRTESVVNQQLRQAAADNPILQQDQLNFRPQQLSQLLRGNTTEDNAVLQQIAGRLVQHQRTTEPAPQAIIISMPEEGSVYTFGRSVQVAENAPLELDLDFDSQFKRHIWQTASVLSLLAAFAATLAFVTTKPEATAAG